MKLRNLLLEYKVAETEPKGHSKFKGQKFAIYQDPSDDEKEEIKGMVRALIDTKNKEVYMFSSDLLHKHAANKLGLEYSYSSKEVLPVIGALTTNKLVVAPREFQALNNESLRDLKKQRWFNKHILVK